MTESKKLKTGDQVKQTGYYVDDWQIVETFQQGDILPADPIMGPTHWSLLHYPYDNNVTSKYLPDELRNEIEE